MAKESGGPAFPPHPNPNAPHHAMPEYSQGMDLRDYLAAQALPPIMRRLEGRPDAPTVWADLAYRVADAMIVARAK